jgi:hypothetical protein
VGRGASTVAQALLFTGAAGRKQARRRSRDTRPGKGEPVAGERPTFDQIPTNVMHDEELLALVRQTRTAAAEAADASAEAPGEAENAPTAVYRIIDVRGVEAELLAAAATDVTVEPTAVAEGSAEAQAHADEGVEARAAAPMLALVPPDTATENRTPTHGLVAAQSTRRSRPAARMVLWLLAVATGVGYVGWRSMSGVGHDVLPPGAVVAPR